MATWSNLMWVDDCVIINGTVVRLILSKRHTHNTDFEFTHCDKSSVVVGS